MSAVNATLLALNKVSLQLQVVMSALQKPEIPCTGVPAKAYGSCLEAERKSLALTKSWDNYDDYRLCDACSAFWHAGIVNNRVNDLIRREQLKLAE